jgi:hypothetical protein
VRREVSVAALIPPTLIGFTGLTLLGRPGELIRPYLIARRTNLTFSSQLAAWAVERIFDIGGFTVLIVFAIFLPTDLRFLPNPDIYPRLRVGGFLLVALVAGLALAVFLVAKFGEGVAAWIEIRFSHLAANFGHRVAQRVREFHVGRVDSYMVDNRARLSPSHSCLRGSACAHDHIESSVADGFEHVGLVDPVAWRGWRLAVGDDLGAAAYFPSLA